MATSTILLLISSLLMGSCCTVFLSGHIDAPKWKLVISMLITFCFAIPGMLLLNFLENGQFGGISYFGTHFVAPIGLLIACLILRIPASCRMDLMDILAPNLSFSITIIKINCAIGGCCSGRLLWTTNDGYKVYFPSQIVECITALLIGLFLVYCIRKHKFRGILMPLFYIIYGVARFYLHLLRETKPFLGIFPAGNIWAMLSIAIGVFCLYVHYLRKENQKSARKQTIVHKRR